MSTRYDTISAPGGESFRAYVSEPARPNGHAVILLQEIFGVTRHVRAVADRFAEDGFLALAPDLFWRMEPGVELSHSKEDMQKAFGFLGRYRDEDGLADVAATARHIRAQPGFQGKVAAAGLCLGGKLAYLGATLPEVDAAVGFYGVGIEQRLDAAGALRAPLLLHFGEQDAYVKEAARTQVTQALQGKPVQVHLYPGADHGFYTRGSPADIELARARTNQFLQQAFAAEHP
jgi:carboxymethylenebutenolidase